MSAKAQPANPIAQEPRGGESVSNWLQVDPRKSIAMYQQIVDGVKESIAKGFLQPGDKLPSVRELSVDLTLNHNTVAKAYQELERERIIEVIRGRGTFVAQDARPADRDARIDSLRSDIARLIVEAHHLQMDETEFIELVHQVLATWNAEKEV